MKKLFMVMLAFSMVFAVAATASASLDKDQLIFVAFTEDYEMYQSMDYDWAGSMAASAGTTLGSIDLGLNTGYPFFDNIAAYKWNKGLGGSQAAHAFGTTSMSSSANQAQSLNFGNAADVISRNHNDGGTYVELYGGLVTGYAPDSADTYGFQDRMGDNGGYGGFNLDLTNGKMNMDEGDLTLYMHEWAQSEYDLDWYLVTTMELTLDLETGDVTKGAYMETWDIPVPVPGAIWLLGSAVLGMVGLRRKNS